MMTTGTVTTIKPDRGFGFIRLGPGEPDCFFHTKESPGLPFDARLLGQRVEFETESTDKGLRAVGVRLVSQ